MAYALEVMIVDGGDSTIKVVHTFYGVTEEEVRTYYREHLHSCDYFKSAVKDHRVIEELEQIDDDELPTFEEYDDEEDSEIA